MWCGLYILWYMLCGMCSTVRAMTYVICYILYTMCYDNRCKLFMSYRLSYVVYVIACGIHIHVHCMLYACGGACILNIGGMCLNICMHMYQTLQTSGLYVVHCVLQLMRDGVLKVGFG